MICPDPLDSLDTTIVRLRIYRGIDSTTGLPTIINARPSRPQNVRVTYGTCLAEYGCVTALWDANVEPDVVAGGYYEV